MRTRALAVLAAAVLALAGAEAKARARGPSAPLAAAGDSLDRPRLRLGRAALERAAGNRRGVIENLETLDFATPSFPEADRAALLLGQAYLEAGAADRLAALARRVAAWPARGPGGEWLALQLQVLELRAAAGDSAAPAPPGVPPLATGARSLAALSAADTASALGRDLAGAALLRRAAEALERGEDARALLERVPAGSRHAARARHVLALHRIERGDTAHGVRLLEALAADSGYAGRREVLLTLAGRSLDAGRWTEARAAYAAIEADRTRHRRALKRIADESRFDELWSAWRSSAAPDEALMLDARPARLAGERLAAAAADLGRPLAGAEASLAGVSPSAARWPVPPPGREAWRTLWASRRAVGEAEHDVERARWALAGERERLDARWRYYAAGLAQVRRAETELDASIALLDSLRRNTDAIRDRLEALRDAASRRAALRSRAIAESAERNLVWMRAQRHLWLEGPHRARPDVPPPGLAGPDSVLGQERALAEALAAAARAMEAEVPELIRRSHDRAWRPRLLDRVEGLRAEALAARVRARALRATIDSMITGSASSRALARLADEVRARERALEERRREHRRLRAEIARGQVEGALAALEAEREAIDYGLASAAYAVAVRLPAPGAPAAAAPSDSAAEADDAAAARDRDQAALAWRDFLERHPGSAARGEARFRLADLMLVDARHRFREEMRRFVAAQDEGRAEGLAVPVLDPAAALDLYRTILAEDPAFEHRDAALFNAGMILADQGSAEAAALFAELTAGHPGSPYVQEAELRRGDLEFNEKRYAAAMPLYERAAAGPDPGLAAIALYKLGWARFNEDRYLEAADAFRAVLDLYGGPQRAAIHADVESEAESYLVHSLAGAGGAPAFAATFDRIGPRPYERRVLLALGQHHRRLGQYAAAVADDELFLARYPEDREALASARRLVDTYRRWERPEEARAAEGRLAPRFLPAGRWAAAQASDSARAAGSEFARGALKSVAYQHHRDARAGGSAEDWRRARAGYQALSGTWPADPDRALHELHAGEAAAALGDHPGALAHYRAAEAGPDSVARHALHQRVAVTDAWYESVRARGAAAGAPSRDSLAGAVLAAGDALLERFPDHPQAADLAWRQGQLAFEHGRHERAAADFGRLASRHPRDPRAPLAALRRADALFRLAAFDRAGDAYRAARQAGKAAGVDSIERRAAAALPICAYRHAEAAVAADSAAHGRHAVLFERVAADWPDYEHAHVARYRAGLSRLAAGDRRAAIEAFEALIRDFPRSEYARDAQLQIAQAWKALDRQAEAAAALARFAWTHGDDPGARDAWLEAADLYAAAGDERAAEDLRLAYIRRWPGDVEEAMTILETLATRELDGLGDRFVSALLPARAPAAGGRGRPSRAARADTARSRLAEYLARAAKRPDLASARLLARVRFLEGEESNAAYAAARLGQPLTTSLPAKQKLLDRTLGHYRRSIELGDSEWAHAAAFRIGEALVGFGEALERSERPADLHGDDLLAYEDVLFEKSQPFHDRGEAVWSDLLRQRGQTETPDAWITRTRTALWQRLAGRFQFHPEAGYPVAAAPAAPRARAAAADPGAGDARAQRQEAGR